MGGELFEAAGFRDRTRDAWITQRVRARLLSDRNIRSVNFNVEAYGNTVYLLGLARSQAELERASSHAALVDGVTDVISFVQVAGVPTSLPARGERRAAACAGEPNPGLDPDAIAPNSEPELLGGPESN